MEDFMKDVKHVLKNYDFEVLNIKTESYKGKKGVWWIQTTKGTKILKKQSQSAKTLDFIIAAMNYLMTNGIHLPEIILTTDGKPYAMLDKTCYILSEAIQGITLSYHSTENIERMIKEMARFHKASVGFIPPDGAKARTHLGLWMEKYQNQIDKLKKYYDQECSNKEHSEFGRIILEEYPYFFVRIESAMQGLSQPSYQRWVEETSEKFSLCHQDFTAGNLILTEADKLYVLDTDSLTIDIPMRDIRKILNKIFKRKKKWDVNLVNEIFAWYHSVNPLEKWQWEVIKPTLTYPHLFAGIMSKYYERREESWTEGKYLKRLKEMIALEKSMDPVLENIENLYPV